MITGETSKTTTKIDIPTASLLLARRILAVTSFLGKKQLIGISQVVCRWGIFSGLVI